MMCRLTHFTTLGIVLIAFSVMPPVVQADEGDDLYDLSLGLIRQERYETAAETLEKLVTQFPKHSRTELARFRLGVINLTLKKYEPARNNLRQFAANNKESKNLPEALYHIGYSSFQLGDMKAAEQEFQTFHRQFPEHPSREKSLAYLGYAQLQNKKAAEALVSFEASLKAFPQGAMREDVLWGQANALVATGKTKEAIEGYRQIAENPTGVRNDQALMKLGQLYYEQSQYADSATQYARLAKEFPKSNLAGTARMNAGYAFFQGKQYEQAKEQFATAATAGVQRPMALYWQGLSEKSLGELDSAVTSFEASAKAVGNVPAAAPIIFQWADALLKLGKYEDSQKQFLASQQVDPKADTADDSLYLAAESALLLADLESATSLLNRMDKEYPESGLAGYQKLLRGQIGVRQGTEDDLKRAEATFRELLSHANQSLSQLSRFHLARCLEKQDRCPDALTELEPLLPLLTPDSSAELFEAYLIAAECHRRLAMKAHLEARPLRKQLELVESLPSEDSATELNQRIEQLSATATSEAKQSLTALQQFLKLKPTREGFADVLQIQAICWALAGDEVKTASALKQLSEGAAEPSLAAKLYFETAEIAYDVGRYSWASQQFETLATLDPKETWRAVALSGLGWSHYKQKQFEKAADYFATIVTEEARHELAPEASFMQAEALRKAEKIQAAQQQFARTFEMFAPTEPVDDLTLSGPATFARRAGLESARTLKAMNKIPEADLAYETVLERFPNHTGTDRLLSEWAVMNANADRFERSDLIFQRLLTENPSSPYAANARLSLAESAILSGNTTTARTQLQTLTQNAETDPAILKRALALLIRIEITAGNWDSVDQLGKQYQSRYPEDDFRNDADFYRAEALLNQDKHVEAGNVLEELYKKRDQAGVKNAAWFARLWVLMAEVAIRQKDYDRVFQLAEEMNGVEETKPFRYQMQEVTGRAHKNKARFAEAIVAFEAVTKDEFGEKTQTAAKCQFLIGETLLLQKKYKPALEAYLKVYLLYQFPQWQAPALFQAGQCDEALEQWQKALTSYEDLLRDFPKSEYAGQAKQRIAEVKRKVE